MEHIFPLFALLLRSIVSGGMVPELDASWSDFRATYHKSYGSVEEENYRRYVWQDNVRYITEHNLRYDLGQETFTLGINQFADLTLDEFKKSFLGGTMPTGDDERNDTKVFIEAGNVRYPDAVDWRTKGYVTPVKNQGQCGSCWAFSATGALEGQHFRSTGQLTSLSEQNLVDCSRKIGNNGCDGGLMHLAFKYVAENRGIDTEASYPYEAKDGQCRYRPSGRGATCRNFFKVANAESSLLAAVATIGPISIAIDASHQSFQFYRSGVYDEPECSSIHTDHGVLVVGYGATDDGESYWLVKNSWGTGWGQQGYIMMSRNKNNQCGIASYATYPIV